MKISRLDGFLFCSHCDDETLHGVQYLNDKIHTIECTNCQLKIEMELNPTRELYKEAYKRITSKPKRLTQEYHKGTGKFISGIPKRVLSKPYRLAKYVNETRKVFKNLNDH